MAEGGDKVEADSENNKMLSGLMEMLAIMERNRIASEDRFMRLFEESSERRSQRQQEIAYHVMPDLSQSIPDFDGECLGKVAVDWLERLEGTALLHKWPQEFMLETAKIHLVGTAKKWYCSNVSQFRTFEEFKSKFKRTFDEPLGKNDLWEKMRRRYQGKQESILSYFHDKLALCKALEFDFEESKHQILIGLLDKSIIAGILATKHDNEDDLLHDIVKFSKVVAQGRGFHHTFGDRRSGNYSHASGYQKQEESKGVQEESREAASDAIGARKKRIVCFKCKEEGHMKRNCRNAYRPSEAADTTSMALPIRSDAAIRRSSSLPVTQSVVNAEDSSNIDSIYKFVKPIKLNDVLQSTALIDPGSAVCTVKSSFVDKYNLPFLQEDRQLCGFGKGNVTNCSRKTILKVAIDDVCVEKVECWLVNDDVQDLDFLIGRTFTEDKNIAYVRRDDNLYFGYKDNDPFINLELPVVNCRKFKATENVIILKNTVGFINTSVNDVDINIPVLNSSDANIEISKNQILYRSDVKDLGNVKKFSFSEPIPHELIKIGENISEVFKVELFKLINEFRKSFAMSLHELGCTDVIKMDINDTNVPVRSKPYKCSTSDRNEISRQVKELKELGIVTETNSSYTSPVLLVGKNDGSKRLVIDYRRLNNQTLKMNYPIPQIDEQFEDLSGCSLFTTLDLTSGYLQVPLTPKAQEKTAFITNDETGQFTRMTFGLTNAPYEFSRMMNIVLDDLRNKICVCYLDDVLVPAKDWPDMISRLRMVFSAFQQANLTMNIKKCEFGKEEVPYLGFLLSKNGIKPGLIKMKAIEEFPKPRNVHEVRRFLGLTGYFRRFIKNYAMLAKPITDLTRKDESFSWSERVNSAFEELKMKLIQSPVLHLYNRLAKTELHTDGSAVGVAGILMQEGEDGQMHMIYCVSKKNSEAEQKYHSHRTELLAIVWSVERLRSMLIGIHFVVVTDCQALTYLHTQKEQKPQIARWYTTLMEYDFEIRHRKGTSMCHVDALSRAPVDEDDTFMEDLTDKKFLMFSIMIEEDKILMIQLSDEKLRELIEILKKEPEEISRKEKGRVRDFRLEEGRLYKAVKVNGEDRSLCVIPDTMRKAIVMKYHDQMGHFSVDKTVAKILETCYFKNLRKYVRRHINGCFECLLAKNPGGKRPGLLHPIPLPEAPMERLHLDHLGPFPKSQRGNSYVLVVIDALTKFVQLYSVKTTRGAESILKMNSFIRRFGTPKMIVTDRGSAFTSNDFKEFCTQNGIRHNLVAVRWAQANGQVEVINRTIVPMISTTMKKEENWDEVIKDVERFINTTENGTTGKTPFKCLFGYTPRFEDAKLANEIVKENYEDPLKIQEKIRDRVKKIQEDYKRRHDKKKFQRRFNVGDIVALRKVPEITGKPTKLQMKYRGPLVVIKDMGKDVYKVEELKREENGHTYCTNAHVAHLKLYRNATEDESLLSDSEEEEEFYNISNSDIPDIENDMNIEENDNIDSDEEIYEEDSDYKPDEEIAVIERKNRPNRDTRIPKRLEDYDLTTND